MNPDAHEKLRQEVREGSTKPFEAGGWYSQEADCLYCFLKADDTTERLLDDYVTLFHGDSDGSVVGIQVKGIKQLCEDDKGLACMIENDHKLRVAHIILFTFEIRSKRGQIEPDLATAYAGASRYFLGKEVPVPETLCS